MSLKTKDYNIQLQARDIDILKFINTFGYTFTKVIENTFFEDNSKNSHKAIKRIKLLERSGYILLKETDLRSYSRAIFLTKKAKLYIRNVIGIDEEDIIKNKRVSSAVAHQVAEQYTYFHLKKLDGEIERTTVYRYSKKIRHTPDFIYTSKNGTKMYIEVETSMKSKKAYNNIYKQIRLAEDIYRPNRIVYVVDGIMLDTLAKKLPKPDSQISISLIKLEEMISNIKQFGQPKPRKIQEILEELQSKSEQKEEELHREITHEK